nr:f-box/lrr-repeat protein [Quercus suber]
MFAHIVSSVLAQQECGELQTFRLQWKFGWDGSHLDAWLRTAAARKVKELDLDIYTDREENLKLPPSFFSCRTLVVLKLISTLHEHSFFSGCPVLGDLSFTITDLFEGEYKLCVPTLKRLSISENVYIESDYEFEINTPALEYFNFEGDLRDIKFHQKLDNLVQADVESYVYEDERKQFFREWVFSLFTAQISLIFPLRHRVAQRWKYLSFLIPEFGPTEL